MYYGANVVIIGKASSEKTGMVSDFHSVRAYLEVQVHKTDSDKIIAAHNLQISGAGITENSASKMAFNLAGEQMADYLLERLAEYRNLEEIKTIHLFIDNLKSDYQFDKLKELIGKMLSVIEVKVNFIENDRAELILKSLGDMQGLVENLYDLSLMDLDIKRTKEDTLHITVR